MVGERIAICQSYEYFGSISLCEDSDEWLCPESWLARPPPMPPLPPFTAYPPPPGFPDFERLHFHVAPPPPKALSRHTQIANSIMEYTSIVVEGLFVCVVIFFVYLFFAAGFGRSSTLKRRKVRRSRNGSGAGAEDAADGEDAEETAEGRTAGAGEEEEAPEEATATALPAAGPPAHTLVPGRGGEGQGGPAGAEGGGGRPAVLSGRAGGGF